MTAQIQERLIIDDKEYGIGTEPLEPYIKSLTSKFRFVLESTACWRGYLGTWHLDGDKLYLISLEGFISNEQDIQEEIDINYLFPNKDKIFASWYSGTIRVVEGKMLEYVHSAYESKYERDLLLNFKKGFLVDYEYIDNRNMDSTNLSLLQRILLYLGKPQ